MTTAARRARKKANKLKGWPAPETPEVTEAPPVTGVVDAPPVYATEAEHAAALAAMAKVRRLKGRME